MQCVAYIINLAVQAALTSLKAVPSVQTEIYRLEQGAAGISTSTGKEEVVSALIKLRRHIYVFRNRQGWKEALKAQTIAIGIKSIQLSLDMLV